MAAVATNTFAGSNFSASDTVSGIPIGAAFPGRVVVIAFVSTVPSPGVTGTINGAAADIAQNANGAAFAAAVVSTGTTASLKINGATGLEILGAWSLTGFPSTVAQFMDFNTFTTGGMVITVADNQCAVGFTVSATQGPGPTPSFSTTLTNDGAVFNTNVAGPFAGVHPSRDGSANFGVGGGGTPTVTVTGFSGTWYIAAGVYGGTGFIPPDISTVGPTWIETRCG